MRMTSLLGMRNIDGGGFDSGEGTILIRRHYYDDFMSIAKETDMCRAPWRCGRIKDSTAVKAAKRNNRSKKGKK